MMSAPSSSSLGLRMAWARRTAVCLSLAAVTLAQPAGQAQTGDALLFAKSYTITGNYVVGGVDLQPATTSTGFLTGTIPMTGVPANADVLAAFLYWETVSNNVAQVAGVKFRGSPVRVVKMTTKALTSDLSQCWASGGGPQTLNMFRADVLALLPHQKDVDGKSTGRRLVNDADLLNYGLARHTVTLPESGTGNKIPQSAGASLFVVYRDLDDPLTKIVVYDGAYVQPKGVAMKQTLRGFLQSSVSPKAKMTHIIGSGGNSNNDRLWFTGGVRTLVSTDPIQKTGPASDRGWANPTFDVSNLMGGVDQGDGYGEKVVTELNHTRSSPYDCLSWAAIIFSTTVADLDKDNLIDKHEDSVNTLKEPNGADLPNLKSMGANSQKKDLFLEVGALTAPPGTTYGSVSAPFSPTVAQVTDEVGHNHLPPPAVWKTFGDAYKFAPVTNPNGTTGINVHIDVGPLAAYRALGPAYESLEADEYFITTGARGGELMTEIACVEDPATPAMECRFPDYPGTVSYKTGLQLLRDSFVASNGAELSSAEQDACATTTGG